VAVVIGTAVIPTLIASLAFVPRHLLAQAEPEAAPSAGRETGEGVAAAAAAAPAAAAAALGGAVMRALREIDAPFIDERLLTAALEEIDLEEEQVEEVADEG
jgi:hypothetical protein